ncbi:bacillithiol system redox-active protein YtxJ [Paenibacillus sp. J5C_2022]|uniref:bacillithiol system redox-active protein YtxJ n=1 Tax=Paenibacillus sp. J5C2022 TaxID=2977129 RepID=UPI0021CDF116|nr:bacillithiol system redox-active protein YtxJ [Paenibacillus sp. J5C2022]MCU6712237.1 bacillithiol system redox-active protein YtxJ [Paenibacillus sp. J5C2022]
MGTYKELTSLEQWSDAFESSGKRPLVVFKHSTQCNVSADAYGVYSDHLQASPSADVDYLFVKVIESRPVSNRIAEDTGIKHASPQLLYIKNKEVVASTSHWHITDAFISEMLQK